MNARNEWSADGLLRRMRQGFDRIPDRRPLNVAISLSDALMSGLALFALKDPSLLAFDDRRAAPENLRHVFGIEAVPSDTQLRKILDDVEPDALRPLFKEVVQTLQGGNGLETMRFMGRYYLVSLDGTGYFSSKKIHCESCQQRRNHTTGEITYSHQLLGAAIVHPDQRAVIPLAPEAIERQDGSHKNDCERNAAKRLVAHLRADYPRWPLIIIEDALSANAPHLSDLKQHDLRFILGVKAGDHAYLFEQVAQADAEGRTTTFEVVDGPCTQRFRFLNDAPLNASNSEVRVNFLEYWEIQAQKTLHFSWITDFRIDRDNAMTLMRGGRARWKIENETFNTLKNQGYHFEHNFGHGHKHLSVIFALLMMLAFAIDQAQQVACPVFQAAWRGMGSKRRLWERLRSLFYELPFASMTTIWHAIAYGFHIEGRIVLHDSS